MTTSSEDDKVHRSVRLLAAFLLIFAAVVIICMVCPNASCDTHTLVLAGNAGDAATWDNGIPSAGDDLVLTGAYNLVMNQAITYGNITLSAGYSGVTTQSAVFGYHNFLRLAGTWTGSTSHDQICSGNFVASAGISTQVLRLNMTGDGVNLSMNGQYCAKLWITGHVTNTNGFSVNRDAPSFTTDLIIWPGGSLTNKAGISWYSYRPSCKFWNLGEMNGGSVVVYVRDVTTISFKAGTSTSNFTFSAISGVGANMVVPLSGNINARNVTVSSAHASYTCTLDFNGYSSDIMKLTAGTRGVIKCGEGAIKITYLDSSVGDFDPETSVLEICDGGTIKQKAGQHIDTVIVDGVSLILGSDVNVTGELSFHGMTASHPYGWYENGTRVSSITTDADGTYSLGSGVFAWDNATLLITPVITIDGWEHKDAFRNTVWQGYDYWADHDCDLPVTWSISTSKEWLTIDDDGMIFGVPDEDGTCYYTITVTHINGETATTSGYIDVETSLVQETSNTIGAIVGVFVVILIIGVLVTLGGKIHP